MANANFTSISRSTPSLKRKSFAEGHSNSSRVSSTESLREKRRRLNKGTSHTDMKTLSKPTSNGYNVLYMAAMCYNAYVARQREARIETLSEIDAQTFKAKLSAVFKELESGKIVQHVDEALDTIPVLACRSPTRCKKRKQLITNFIDTYRSIRDNLSMLDMLVVGLHVNETLFDCLYKKVSGIHYDLNKAEVWHNVLPYTHLSLIGLRKLRERIIGWKEYRRMIAALSNIDDIEYWLTLPPKHFVVPDSMRKIAMESMYEFEEARLQSLYEPSPGIPSFEQLLARIKKEDAEKERARELERTRKEQESARWATMEAQAEARRQQERADAAKRELERRKAETKFAAQSKLQEAKEAEAKATTEKELREKREAETKAAVERKLLQQKDAEAKAVAEKKSLEEKEAEAKSAAKRKLQELHEAAEVTRRATELEQRKFQDALMVKENERKQLRTNGEAKKKSTREILTYLERGSIPENVLEMFHWPSKLESLAKLTNLWISNQQRLTIADPRQLLVNPDLLLQLEYSIFTEVLSALVVLKARSCDPREIFATGWCPDVLGQFQSLLIPYTEKEVLSGLIYVVNTISKVLADFKMASRATMDVSTGSTASQRKSNPFFSPSISNQSMQRFAPLAKHPFGNNASSTVAQPDTSHVDMLDATESHQTRTRKDKSAPKVRNPLPCKFVANGTCSRGERCNYTHPWDMLLEEPLETPCYYFFRKGSCRNDDSCHLSRNTALFGPPQVNKQPGKPKQMQQRFDRDASFHSPSNGSHSIVSSNAHSHWTRTPQPQRSQNSTSLLDSMDDIIRTGRKPSGLHVSHAHSAKTPKPQQVQKPAGLFESLDDIIGARHKTSAPHDSRSKVPCREGANCTRKNCAFKHDRAADASKRSFPPTGRSSNGAFGPPAVLGSGFARLRNGESNGHRNGNHVSLQAFNEATSTHNLIGYQEENATQPSFGA